MFTFEAAGTPSLPLQQAPHPEFGHGIEGDRPGFGRAAFNIQKKTPACLQIQSQKNAAAALLGESNACVGGRHAFAADEENP